MDHCHPDHPETEIFRTNRFVTIYRDKSGAERGFILDCGKCGPDNKWMDRDEAATHVRTHLKYHSFADLQEV